VQRGRGMTSTKRAMRIWKKAMTTSLLSLETPTPERARFSTPSLVFTSTLETGLGRPSLVPRDLSNTWENGTN